MSTPIFRQLLVRSVHRRMAVPNFAPAGTAASALRCTLLAPHQPDQPDHQMLT